MQNEFSLPSLSRPPAAEPFRLERLRLCLSSVPQSQLATVVNGLLLYVFLTPVVPALALQIWFVALLVAGAGRFATYLYFRRHGDTERMQGLEAANLYGAIAGGVLWGSVALFLFPSASLPHQTFLAFVVGGMTAGAVTTLSSHRVAACTFIVLALAPLALRFALAGHEFAGPMAFMTALFMLMMLVAALRLHAHFHAMLRESLRREAAERELAQMAWFDPLTELPNRRLFIDQLERAIAAARRQRLTLAVCCFDLDNFRALNERYGHAVGDDILRHAAQVLKTSVRAGDVIARWGGDEFAVLLTGLADREACRPALERLAVALAAPFTVDGREVVLHASIGATLAPRASDDPDTLLREADHAMFLAKRAGRNGYHIFDPDHDGDRTGDEEAARALRDALASHELRLFVQPKVAMDSGAVYGAEALVRWEHPERGLLAPAAFLPQWEADASMAELDRWVIQQSLQQIEDWLEAGLRVVLSVNVSAWLLHDPDFTGYLAHQLAQHPRARGLIELEVTETRALDDINRISDVMRASAALGVEFALDDFGTGFSSLVHLQCLPAQALKIDTSFVRGMLDNDHDRNLVRGIIGLGDALGKDVVAEGVETVAHGRALLDLGCRHAQGYGIAPPMPAAALPAWVEHYAAPAEWRASARPRVLHLGPG